MTEDCDQIFFEVYAIIGAALAGNRQKIRQCGFTAIEDGLNEAAVDTDVTARGGAQQIAHGN